jgi:uncharacterized YccA/Bax inhibitor family protein
MATNGFVENWWGDICKAVRSFILIFDVNPLALVAFLICNTAVMAWVELLTQGTLFTTPEWWVGPTGVLYLVIVTLLGKHTVGYLIASKYNSPQGTAPTQASDLSAEPKAGG